MERKLKILLGGYYGFGNLGDELILSVIVKELRQRFPNADLKILSADPAETELNHLVPAVNRWNPLSVFLSILRSDFFFLGGGGLFQDTTSGRSLMYYLLLILAGSLAGKKVILLSVGIESVQNNFLRKLTRVILSLPGVSISVRDEASKMILEEMGLTKKPIEVKADPVFAYEYSKPAPHEQDKPAKVLFIPRFPQPEEGLAIFEKIEEKLQRMNISSFFTLFQPVVEMRFWKNSMAAFFSEDKLILGQTIADQANLIWDFDYVISSRLHGLILAAKAGKPFLGVGNKNKIGRFCEKWERPFLDWKTSEKSIDAELGRLLREGPLRHSGELEKLHAAAQEAFAIVKF